MIKPNDTIALIMLLVSVCSTLAAILFRRHMRPGRFMWDDSITSSYDNTEQCSMSSPRHVDPLYTESSFHVMVDINAATLLGGADDGLYEIPQADGR